jgi:acyl carrier protein
MRDMGIDAVELVMQVEEAFGIELPDEGLSLATVGKFSQYISKRVENYEPDAVWEIVQRIVAENLNIPLSEVRPDSRWIEDLKVD